MPVNDNLIKGYIAHRRGDLTLKSRFGAIETNETAAIELYAADGIAMVCSIELQPDGNAALLNFVTPINDNHLVTKRWVEENSGGENNGNIDGGKADSIYETDQIIDGGGA